MFYLKSIDKRRNVKKKGTNESYLFLFHIKYMIFINERRNYNEKENQKILQSKNT